MSSTLFQLQDELGPLLRRGDLAGCERRLVEGLRSLPRSPFHAVLDRSITNDPREVCAFFDEFFERQRQRFVIRAAYVEMNGFDVNTDLWFFTAFAFERYGGHDNHDWLSAWQSEDSDAITVEGLEELQSVYASDAFRNESFSQACSITSLLVIVKFQELIRRAATLLDKRRFPLLAAAHDFDFVYEVNVEH